MITLALNRFLTCSSIQNSTLSLFLMSAIWWFGYLAVKYFSRSSILSLKNPLNFTFTLPVLLVLLFVLLELELANVLLLYFLALLLLLLLPFEQFKPLLLPLLAMLFEPFELLLPPPLILPPFIGETTRDFRNKICLK